MVAMAAAFPIPIPRSTHSIATGDSIVFLMLALHGVPAAALAAGAEGLIGAVRTSKRLSSRIASLAAAAAGMTLAGALFEAAQSWLQGDGLPPAAAHLAALAAAALAYCAIPTSTLMQVICLKRGVRLTFAQWFGSASWVGALYLVSAVLAGLLSLNAQQFGRSAAAVGVLVIGLSLALLRAHFRQQIAEHEAQEARVAAAEQEAQENQKRFHSAFTHASIGMAIGSAQGEMMQANDALCRLLGYDERGLLHRPFRDLLHPGDASLLERHVVGVAAGRMETFSIELRCRGAGQRETWVSLHCALFGDTAGPEAGLIFQLHDITSRRRA